MGQLMAPTIIFTTKGAFAVATGDGPKPVVLNITADNTRNAMLYAHFLRTEDKAAQAALDACWVELAIAAHVIQEIIGVAVKMHEGTYRHRDGLSFDERLALARLVDADVALPDADQVLLMDADEVRDRLLWLNHRTMAMNIHDLSLSDDTERWELEGCPA
jgi:hypothetical protein